MKLFDKFFDKALEDLDRFITQIDKPWAQK